MPDVTVLNAQKQGFTRKITTICCELRAFIFRLFESLVSYDLVSLSKNELFHSVLHSFLQIVPKKHKKEGTQDCINLCVPSWSG